MTIDVTLDDIRHGSPGKCRWCPIARAIQRATGRFAWVGASLVGSLYSVRLFNYVDGRSAETHEETLPSSCSDFIKRFDIQILSVKPFSFELDYALSE